ncbi:MAG: SDR family oxidoreductase [Alphaproteobacteria bacterium]|nr:SDR family oxidoreductase [Alphaproteobacteria bacterium]MBL6940037.1 SDR family oxidoreductase [Alphaproteobacteria bacterium]MBL7098107.1 SDR family oxidoreductase [Alphaproteobacteria bacterium]
MRILLSGANGFIGRYLLARLVGAGHEVIPAVRDVRQTNDVLGRPASIPVDFNRDVTPETWLPRLKDIDAVINCVGILQGRPGQSIQAIHAAAPIALFKACQQIGVKRVIQISAISSGADTAYAHTKQQADTFLEATTLDWIVLRPSLVYAAGAYGGTLLFRALAALPFAIPLIGKGEQEFQPIHMDDLTATVLRILATPAITRTVIDPVGPETLSLRQILLDLRRWLGLSSAPTLSIPLWLVRPVARVGDAFGGTINTTALRQLAFGNTGSLESFVRATGIQPRRWHDMLLAYPAQLQDRWAARLYFLRPLLRWAIALTWFGSGLAGLFHRDAIAANMPMLGQAPPTGLIWAVCLLDLLIGAAVVARWRTRLMTAAQVAVVAGYTTVLTLSEPSLWIEPFGPLLKNLPFVAAVLALAVLETER